MISKTQINTSAENDHMNSVQANSRALDAILFKKRMLEWSNPVEYVNNMYGCHPDDKNNDYFKVVFAK